MITSDSMTTTTDTVTLWIVVVILIIGFVFAFYKANEIRLNNTPVPKHARKKKRPMRNLNLDGGERFVFTVGEPVTDETFEVPPVRLSTLSDLENFGRMRGALYITLEDILNERVDPERVVEHLFGRARASGIELEVVTYRDQMFNRIYIRWIPAEPKTR